jgi:phenylacetate-CoA ligase
MHSWLSQNIFLPWVIHGPWTASRRQYRRALREARLGLQAWEHGSPESRQRWVLRELREIVRWAGEHVPYYRGLFRKVGFDPAADFTLADYQQLPVLEKETVRNCADALIAEGFSRNTLRANVTGGSTGVPLRFWQDARNTAWRDTVTEWAYARVGFRVGDRLGLFWGVNLDPWAQQPTGAWVRDWLAHQQKHDCFRLSDAILDRVDSRLSKYRPDFLRGYSAALAALARRLSERGSQPSYPRRGIITGAEKLDAHQRALIEAAFQVPVFESYGSRDCGLLAMQLSAADQRLYVVGINLLIEPYGEPDPISGTEIVVTVLHNQAMPFLRYRIGDRARLPADASEPPIEIFEEVIGRTLDHIRLPDGRLIHSTMFMRLFRDRDIWEYQVRQEEDGTVQVFLVAGPRLTSEHLERIERILRDNLCGVPLSVSLVPAIERSLAGKLRPVISHYRLQESAIEAMRADARAVSSIHTAPYGMQR